MKKSVTLMLGLLSSLLFAAALVAGEKYGDTFGTLDADRDGQLSAMEVSNDPELSAVWTEIDTDENGVIDRAEFSAFEASYEGSGHPGAKDSKMME